MGTKSNPGEFDCYTKAGDDEPIFTLRAKDENAPYTILTWIICATIAGVDPAKIAEARACRKAMRKWRRLNVPVE